MKKAFHPTVVVVCSLFGVTSLSIAGPQPEEGAVNAPDAIVAHDPSTQFLFEGGELFLDFYGAATRELIDDTAGIGLGAGYYVTRNWGFIFTATWVDDETEFKETESGKIVTEPGRHDSNIFLGALCRLPVDEAGIAFYGVAGMGGYVGGDSIRTWEIGGGIEARLTYHISGLLEARYVEPESNTPFESETLFKIGLRYIF